MPAFQNSATAATDSESARAWGDEGGCEEEDDRNVTITIETDDRLLANPRRQRVIWVLDPGPRILPQYSVWLRPRAIKLRLDVNHPQQPAIERVDACRLVIKGRRTRKHFSGTPPFPRRRNRSIVYLAAAAAPARLALNLNGGRDERRTESDSLGGVATDIVASMLPWLINWARSPESAPLDFGADADGVAKLYLVQAATGVVGGRKIREGASCGRPSFDFIPANTVNQLLQAGVPCGVAKFASARRFRKRLRRMGIHPLATMFGVRGSGQTPGREYIWQSGFAQKHRQARATVIDIENKVSTSITIRITYSVTVNKYSLHATRGHNNAPTNHNSIQPLRRVASTQALREAGREATTATEIRIKRVMSMRPRGRYRYPSFDAGTTHPISDARTLPHTIVGTLPPSSEIR
ncbi:hypothetical protein OE88DRAFT_1644462 [Heliocybe sulcata]|uniref:Uncharacterized protein n=1 Tax=Heliocybe sulcata TaxID=5364 RepID=A0A5C3N6X3_9AGAM|nr:hypothetical protein OE88DRAFT_1644462 [Heliocybe sulcata]